MLNQTYKDFELILINDGSTDGSLEIIEKFASKDDRIRVINDGVNKGLIYRLNQSVSLIQTDIYVRMDADDIMFSDRLEKQIEILKKHPDVCLVHSEAVSINSKNEVIGIKNNTNVDFPIHPTVMARKSFFEENKYREGFFQMEDAELWHRTKESNFYCIKEPLLFYREDSAKIYIKHKKMYKGLVKFCKSYNFSWLSTFKILMLSRAKYFSYFILESIGFEKKLLNLRYNKLGKEEKEKYQQILYATII